MTDTVIELAEQFKAALARQDMAAERRLITAYRGLWATIREKADALILEISTLEEPTPGQVQRLKRYGALMEDIRQELGRFGTYARVEMSTAAREAIRMGEGNARILTAAQLGNAQLASQLNRLNPEAIERLLGFLSSDGALFKRLDKLSGWTAQQVADAILEGVALGKGPRATAKLLSKSLMDGVTEKMGMALTDALRMMRTVQLYSYREANRASYIANSDVVRGWIWYADLAKACASCIAMHGTEHGLDEVLDDHFNGGCAALPLVIGAKNDIESGADWFANQSEAYQKQTLGEGKYEAWKDGKFEFSQLSSEKHNDVYGMMRVETSLADLLSQ
ncbi:MAG: structural protein [Saccharofermentanales bacterium]